MFFFEAKIFGEGETDGEQIEGGKWIRSYSNACLSCMVLSVASNEHST